MILVEQVSVQTAYDKFSVFFFLYGSCLKCTFLVISCKMYACFEILIICYLHVFYIQHKCYSRTAACELALRGRIRVCLKNSDGSPINEAIPTRKALFYFIAERINETAARIDRKEKDANEAVAAADALALLEAEKPQQQGKKGKKKGSHKQIQLE